MNIAFHSPPDPGNIAAWPLRRVFRYVDRQGNESDMTTIAEPFLFKVPEAPHSLSLEPADEFVVIQEPREEVIEPEVIQRLIAQLDDDDTPEPLYDQDIGDHQEADEAPSRFDIGAIF